MYHMIQILEQVFNNLATEKDLRQRMMEQGAAPAIIALAASSHNRSLRSDCVEALCKLAVLPGSEPQIIAEVWRADAFMKACENCSHRATPQSNE